MKTLVLNDSHQDKTVKALKRAAAKASGTARRTIEGLAQALKTNPTKTPGTGRANATGEPMAKKKQARAKRRTTTRKTNPTSAAPKRRSYRRNPTAASFKRSLAGIDLQGVVMEGASIVGGELAQSFVQKQITNLFPSISGTPASLASSAVLAGASLYFGKGNKMLRGVAIGAIAGGIRGLAKGFAPTLFAGDEEVYAPSMGALPDGYIDPTTGEWTPLEGAEYIEGAEEGIEGAFYDWPSTVDRSPRSKF